jgi:hypothetical protein
LWFDDDPLAGPPDNLDYVADINTGRAYTETYWRLIKNPDKQILMGVQFYMDAAVTGQFANLPVTAVWCAFTIFNQHEQQTTIHMNDLHLALPPSMFFERLQVDS